MIIKRLVTLGIAGLAVLSVMCPMGRGTTEVFADTVKTTSSLSVEKNVEKTMWVVQCKEHVSLRAKPSTSAKVLKKVPLYDAVTYLGDASNGFAHVKYKGKEGYVLKKYLDEFEPQIAIGQYMTVINCKKSITLRKKASTTAAKVCQIPFGETVYAIKEAANGFYKVKYDGKTGYALASYLSADTPIGRPRWVVQCKEYVSLRAKPSTSAKVLKKIPLFDAMTYLGDASNGFTYVRYKGTEGYVLSKYLDEFEPQIAICEYRTVANCKKSITLRKKAKTSAAEICQIPLGAKVYVIKDAANGFYQVKYNGKTGYALSKYLKA